MADNPVKRSDSRSGTPATPNVQREVRRTGVEPGDGVGDSPKAQRTAPADRSENDTINHSSKAPSGVNKDLWAQAEASALNGGGFAGLDDKARKDLIQVQYDQMIENDRKTKEWAYGSDKVVEGGLLGDIK